MARPGIVIDSVKLVTGRTTRRFVSHQQRKQPSHLYPKSFRPSAPTAARKQKVSNVAVPVKLQLTVAKNAKEMTGQDTSQNVQKSDCYYMAHTVYIYTHCM